MTEVETIPVTILPDGRMDTLNAARYLGLAAQTLRGYRSRGIGPRWVKVGERLIFYYRADLDQWLNSGEDQAIGNSAEND